MRALTRGFLLLATALAGCGGENTDPPRFQSLLDLRPVRTGAGMAGLAPGPKLTFEPLPDGSGVTAVHSLTPGDWLPAKGGRWRLARPLGFPRATLEVRVGGSSLDCYLLEESLVLSKALPDGPPRDAELRVRLARSAPGEYGGELVPLWPGEELACPLDVGPERALSFQSLLLGGFGEQLAGEVVLTLELDGEALAEKHLKPGKAAGIEQHLVELPPRTDARLVLRARGAPVPLYLASPTLVPRARGTPAARPWPDARPDFVVFLADTFRADLLAMHGADPALTPNLNALAARGRRFLEARSPATWTLPAHASLFTGLWPGEHGAETPDVTFDPALVTLAEALRAAGYRTIAVTQGGFVTRSYGLDQGFELFFEQNFPGGPLTTLLDAAEELLAADDGRPTFLFVHTYRVHGPYRPDADERKQRYVELYNEATARGFVGEKVKEMPPEITAELRGLYDQGANELDLAFGPWFETLARSGRLENGLFVFTSDHGEAFHEHGRFLHGEAAHEEVARIPLFLVGAGVEPGDVGFGASLVDLYPTLLKRAGLAAPAGLAGTDLFTLASERLLFSATRLPGKHLVGVIEGSRKLLALRQGEDVALPRDVQAVYDLYTDPHERAGVGADQAAEFLSTAAPAWAAAATLRAPRRAVTLDQAKQDELKALGYGE